MQVPYNSTIAISRYIMQLHTSIDSMIKVIGKGNLTLLANDNPRTLTLDARAGQDEESNNGRETRELFLLGKSKQGGIPIRIDYVWICISAILEPVTYPLLLNIRITEQKFNALLISIVSSTIVAVVHSFLQLII